MNTLTPFETLFETNRGSALPLPPELASLYGSLQFPAHPDRTYVIGNFVSTLDGVVSLNIPGKSGGGEISGMNKHDRMLMGVLRAIADAVVVGAGTLRAVPQHLWTPEYIFPSMADEYSSLRSSLGKVGAPLNVIVTASGTLDPALPVFTSKVPVLVATNSQGLQEIQKRPLPPWVQVEAVAGSKRLTARDVLDAVNRARNCEMVLVEGGPLLVGDYISEQLLNELFLTLAPQVAGRKDPVKRPGLVEGKEFAPKDPRWAELVSVRRAGAHLFMRYAFRAAASAHGPLTSE